MKKLVLLPLGIVALAALINAARHAGRSLRDSVVGQVGLGAAGTGIVRLLRAYGVERVLGVDRSADAIARLEALGGEGEGRVATLVAVAVVDQLEVVEIDEEHRDERTRSLRPMQRALDHPQRLRPVGQLGQRVMGGLVAQVLLQLFALAVHAGEPDGAAT